MEFEVRQRNQAMEPEFEAQRLDQANKAGDRSSATGSSNRATKGSLREEVLSEVEESRLKVELWPLCDRILQQAL